MSSIVYRPDYAKFVFRVQAGTWHQYSERFHEASHQRKYHAEWLKSHKMSPWYGDAVSGTETWSVDIWGEWAGVVDLLPESFFPFLRRFDIRATVWDATEATIIQIGQHLQQTVTSHNINVYSTKPATKRLGRDRGGKGFAIGSHKSDLRITVYKRTGEPAAQEFQCSGQMMKGIVEEVYADPTIAPLGRSLWRAALARVQARGTSRLTRVFSSAELGTYWPVLETEGMPSLPPIQGAFLTPGPEAPTED